MSSKEFRQKYKQISEQIFKRISEESPYPLKSSRVLLKNCIIYLPNQFRVLSSILPKFLQRFFRKFHLEFLQSSFQELHQLFLKIFFQKLVQILLLKCVHEFTKNSFRGTLNNFCRIFSRSSVGDSSGISFRYQAKNSSKESIRIRGFLQ